MSACRWRRISLWICTRPSRRSGASSPRWCSWLIRSNPTGNLFSADAVRQIIEAAPAGGGGRGLLRLCQRQLHPASGRIRTCGDAHLLQARNGRLRLGFLAAARHGWSSWKSWRLPYNVASCRNWCRKAARSPRCVLRQAEQLKQERAKLYRQLEAVAGFRSIQRGELPLFRCANATAVFDGLKRAAY